MSTMQAQSAARPAVSTGIRVAAYAAMIAGGLGILLSLVLVFGTWYVRSTIDGLSTQLAATVDGGLNQADERLGQAAARIDQSHERVQGMEATAAQLGSGERGQAAAAQLGAAIDRELGPTASAIREAYAGLAARIASVQDLLGTLDRLPFVDLPELQTTQLQALDTRLREINDDLQSARQSLDDQGLPLGTLGERLAEPLGRLNTRIGELQTSIDGLRTEVEGVRQTVAQVQATVMQITTWIAIGLTLVLLWNVLLHLMLLLRGRAWLRGGQFV